MKKTLLLILVTLIAGLPAFATDFEFEYAGQTLTYTITGDNTCKTKEGTDINQLQNDGSYKWVDVAGNKVSGAVEIPSKVTYKDVEYTVTEIGQRSFANRTTITSITIPASITSIGSKAFSGCKGLTKADFESIESLCAIVFSGDTSNPLYNAKNLYINGEETLDVVIPETVTSIGQYTFYGCTNMKSIYIPNSVSSIGKSAFRSCAGLTSINIPNSVTSIGLSAFQNCSSLSEINIPNSITSIPESTFYGCTNLTSITIPSSVTIIGWYAFKGCTALTRINLPNSITEIGFYAFQNCTSLPSITFPSSVTKFGDKFLDGCTGLIKYAIASNTVGGTSLSGITIGNNPGYLIIYNKKNAYTDENGFVFSNDNRTLIFAPTYLPNEYTVPNSVGIISAAAFIYCKDLTEITLSDKISSIEGNAWKGCTSLNKIKYNTSNPCTSTTNIFPDETYNTATLEIPVGTLSTFQNTVPWSSFLNIVETESLSENNDANLEMSLSDNSMVINKGETAELIVTLVGKNAGMSTLTVTITDQNGNTQTETCNIVVQDVVAFIEEVQVNNQPINDIYNLSGILIKKNASIDDVKSLKPGIYIIGNKKVLVR